MKKKWLIQPPKYVIEWVYLPKNIRSWFAKNVMDSSGLGHYSYHKTTLETENESDDKTFYNFLKEEVNPNLKDEILILIDW